MNSTQLLGRQEWTLHDGATLVAMIEEKPIDQYSVIATLVVHHRFQPSSQDALETLSYRFANPESSPEWRDIKVLETNDRDGAITQVFTRAFSAPDHSLIEFRIVKNGQVQELAAWRTP